MVLLQLLGLDPSHMADVHQLLINGAYAKFAALRGHDTVQLVIPSKRLHYERDGAVVKGCSFESVFVTRGLALPRDVVWG